MGQVFTLQINFGAAQLFGEPLGKIKRCRPAYVCRLEMPQFFLKHRVLFGLVISLLKFFEGRDKCLRSKSAAIKPKISFFVRQLFNFNPPGILTVIGIPYSLLL